MSIEDYQVKFRELAHEMGKEYGGNLRSVCARRKIRYGNENPNNLLTSVAETYETEIVFVNN